MKAKCLEHYDKEAEYVWSIGDTTFRKCIERLKQWEHDFNGKYEIELYCDFAPYSFGFAEIAAGGNRGIVNGWLYHGNSDLSFAVTMEPFHSKRLEFDIIPPS